MVVDAHPSVPLWVDCTGPVVETQENLVIDTLIVVFNGKKRRGFVFSVPMTHGFKTLLVHQVKFRLESHAIRGGFDYHLHKIVRHEIIGVHAYLNRVVF